MHISNCNRLHDYIHFGKKVGHVCSSLTTIVTGLKTQKIMSPTNIMTDLLAM